MKTDSNEEFQSGKAEKVIAEQTHQTQEIGLKEEEFKDSQSLQIKEIFPQDDQQNEGLPIEEVLKNEIEKQKLIQQKLKEIEEQNKILAELEAKEKIIRLREEERNKMAESEQKYEIREEVKSGKISAESKMENKFQFEKTDLKTARNEFMEQLLHDQQNPQPLYLPPQVQQPPQELQSPQVPQLPEVQNLPQVPQLPEVILLPQVPPTLQVQQPPIVLQAPQLPQPPQVPQPEGTLHVQQPPQGPHPPHVPGRSSSRNIIRERSFAKMYSPQSGL